MSAVDSAATQPADPPAGRDRLSRGVTVAVTVAVIAAALLAVLTQRLSAHTASTDRQDTAASASYLGGQNAKAAAAAASRETRATLTYNYKTLPADFATAEAGLTPKFRASYQSTTASSVTPLATKYHAVSTAVVTFAGVSAASSTTATVLLFVDQTVTNTQLAHPRLDRSRIKVAMLKLNGRWMVDNLSPI